MARRWWWCTAPPRGSLLLPRPTRTRCTPAFPPVSRRQQPSQRRRCCCCCCCCGLCSAAGRMRVRGPTSRGHDRGPTQGGATPEGRAARAATTVVVCAGGSPRAALRRDGVRRAPQRSTLQHNTPQPQPPPPACACGQKTADQCCSTGAFSTRHALFLRGISHAPEMTRGMTLR